MNDPKSAAQEAPPPSSGRKKAASASSAPDKKTPAHSMRSRRTPSWAKSEDESTRYSHSFYLPFVTLFFFFSIYDLWISFNAFDPVS